MGPPFRFSLRWPQPARSRELASMAADDRFRTTAGSRMRKSMAAQSGVVNVRKKCLSFSTILDNDCLVVADGRHETFRLG